MNDKMTEDARVLELILEGLFWAFDNEGQKYRLRKALVAWLAENDDGKKDPADLEVLFVADTDIDAIVARPKPPITEIYIYWAKPLARIVVFRGNEKSVDFETETWRMSTQGWAVRMQRCLKEQNERQVRFQLVDIDDVIRMWEDGAYKDREDVIDRLYDRLTFFIAQRAPDGDIEEAIRAERLPNAYEDFRLEMVDQGKTVPWTSLKFRA